MRVEERKRAQKAIAHSHTYACQTQYLGKCDLCPMQEFMPFPKIIRFA
jgi:hypothetical protein